VLSPGTIFTWQKGTRLTAMEAATVIIPGAILVDGTPIGDIIHASDDKMEIGFTPKEGSPGFETIILKFQAGQSVTLNRGSDAMLGDKADRSKKFLKYGR
jgi:hypothetical protein